MELLYLLILVMFCSNLLFKKAEGFSIEKIIGGEVAEVQQFNYVVAVMYKPRIPNMPDENLCTGAIIDDWYIATVAHCFFNEIGEYRHNEFYIIPAVTDLRNRLPFSRSIRVNLVIMPSTYNPLTVDIYSEMGNLAIVRLAERLGLQQYTRHFKKIKIARELIRRNDIFTVAGYGWNNIVYITDIVNDTISEIELGESDGKLRFATADIVNRHFCQNTILNDHISADNICVKIRQNHMQMKGICQGDDGAPLTRTDYLAGIAIHGFAKCNENLKPGIYVNVPYYYNFIMNILNGNRTAEMTVIQLMETYYGFVFVEV